MGGLEDSLPGGVRVSDAGEEATGLLEAGGGEVVAQGPNKEEDEGAVIVRSELHEHLEKDLNENSHPRRKT